MKKTYLLLLLLVCSVISGYAQTTTFTYASGGGAVQTYTVPCGVTSVQVDVAGAQGGNYPGQGTGGLGGRAQGTLAVTPGQVLRVYVGQKGPDATPGTTNPGGSNSGGGAQGGQSSNDYGGASGGGSSDIRTNAGSNNASLLTRLIVGAGGGGGAWDCGGENGGAGGGTTGGLGIDCDFPSSSCGGPGTPTAGGASGGSGATAGGFGKGGNSSNEYGGGGGGGWYGAGGATFGGACGGSSYFGGAGVTGGSTTAGFRSGDGYVTITPLGPVVYATPSTGVSFGNVTNGVTSVTQVFSITGTSLTSSPLTVNTTSSNFEFSFNGTTWFSTAQSYPFTVPGFANIPIYVRFTPTALTTYNQNITFSGGGLVCTVSVPVTGTGAVACAGAPVPGTAAIAPAFGNGTTVFAMNTTGYSATGGITFQWQSSPNGTNTWTDIPSATNATYNYTGLSATTYFRANVTCTGSAQTVPTNTLTATYFAASSCTPTFDYPPDATENNVMVATGGAPFTLNGIFGTAINDATPPGSTGYLDETSTANTVTLYNGWTYTATMGDNINNYQLSNQVWIDFNNNGIFEAGESVGGASGWTNTTITNSITIPATAAPGLYRMRVMVVEDGFDYSYPNLPPCPSPFGDYEYGGDVRDYRVTIVQLPPCVTPNQATALTLTPLITSVSGSFTAASPAPDNYLIVMTTTSAQPVPVNGTTYTAGATALGGKIISVNNSTTFNVTGLTPGTQYWFWVYAYNSVCGGGPLYKTPALANTASTPPCSISGIKTVGPTGNYTNLTAAAAALASNGASGPVVLELMTTYTAASETFPVSFTNIPCASSTNTITVRPQGTLTISTGLANNPMFNLNGANYFIIDGRVGSTGTTKALTISNTTASGHVIRFINDASNNIVRYVTLKGVSSTAANAVMQFSTTNGVTGNDNNLIDNCDILDGASTYSNGILSAGTTGKENSNNKVSNCNIANYFIANVATNGIALNAGSTDWTISNNRFYQTATRTYTGTQNHRDISVNTTAGNNFIITGNTMGYASSAGTGTYAMTSTAASVYQSIFLSVGSITPSSVQGNTITAISQATASTAATTSGALCGISITNGSVNVGNITPNTIGSGTATGAITTTTSGSGGALVGINVSAPTPGVVNIQNNIIGGLTANGSAATVSASVVGIQMSSTAAVTVSGNTIGSLTTPNSINANTASTSTTPQLVYGINSAKTNNAIPVTISGNTIANLNLNSGATANAHIIAGILHSNSNSCIISNNTIRNITGAAANTTFAGLSGVNGIAYTGGTGSATISGNTIFNIANTNTGAFATHVIGIGHAASVSAVITHNKIYDLRNASTMNASAATPATADGILVVSGTTNETVDNNMISLGNGQTTNTSFNGISIISNAALARVYYNTVNIEGTSAGGLMNTACFSRGNNGTTALTAPVDVRNNIFNNSRTGGTGLHYAIANGIGVSTSGTVGWGPNASNYNILNSANPASVGYWSGPQTFAGWKAASASDGNSFSASALTFANAAAGDLHINMGLTANNVESHGTTIAGFNTDFDNQARPGPAGSVNGGGFAPDLGADEFDGVQLDNIPPVITYTTLLGSCGTGDRVVSVTLGDFSGVPATGSLRPRIYYKKSTSSTWYSQPGTLVSGTATNGTWNFTIVAADMGGLTTGEIIDYYVIAQDNLGQIASIPSAGLVATDVNTVTTPPTTPNSYAVLPVLGGPYNVGPGGDFTTLTAAMAVYNIACLTGPVTFNLTGSTYSTAETFPITITNSLFANATNTLTIRPAAATAVTITGGAGSPAIFKLLNATYINIDGIKTGGASLTLNNANSGTSADIWLATSATGPGCSFISLKNLNIVGGNNAALDNYGIIAALDEAGAPGTTGGFNNDNITIQGNSIQKCYYGIYAIGAAAVSNGGLDNWTIAGNIIGPATAGANNIGGCGIFVQNSLGPVISGNTIQNVVTVDENTGAIYLNSNVNGFTVSGNNINNIKSTASSSTTSSLTALYMGSNVINGTVTRNNIRSVANMSTGGWGVRAIIANTGNGVSNLLLANNMISDVWGYSDSSPDYAPMGIDIDGSTGGVKVYYNSVNLYGMHPGLGSSTMSMSFYTNTGGSNLDLRNNIFVNTLDNTSSGSDKGWAIYAESGAGVFSNIDYNDYYTAAPDVLGYLSGDQPTLAAIQSAFGGNTHSISVAPKFVTPTNLHLQVSGVNTPLIAGTPIAGVTTDIDGLTRSATTPVIGAHEVAIPPCNSVAGGLPVAENPNLCVSGSTTINLTGASAGYGLNYQWQSSTDSASWTNISGATESSYTIAPAITASTFYRAILNCTLTGSKDSSTTRVIVHALPSISVTPAGAAICYPGTASVTMAATGANSYSWSPATGLSSVNSPVTTATPSVTTTYIVTGTDGNGCSNTATATVTVTATPNTVNVTPSSTAICNGGSVMFTADATASPVALYQDFNSGLGSWTIANDAGIDESYWQIRNSPGYSDDVPGDGSPYLEAAPDANLFDITTTRVTSPAFSLAGYLDATLTFNQYYNYYSGDFAAKLEYSTDGITWTTLADYYAEALAADESPVGSQTWSAASPDATIVLPPELVGQTNVQLRWNYDSDWGLWWAIDNIKVSGTIIPTISWSPIVGLFNDEALTSPYTGDPANTVYAAPTATSVPVNTTYTAIATNAGCTNSTSRVVSVNPLPAMIGGNPAVCMGLTTTLSNAVTGGTWSSASSNVSVDASTGAVTGVAVGTADVTYTIATGCNRTVTVTINALPDAITGNADVCINATNMLSDATPGGTWSSSNTAVGTVNSIGAVTGIVAGYTTITYTASTGCIATVVATVNILPVLNVTPATNATICMGGSVDFTASAPVTGVNLLSQDFNSGFGAWTTTNGPEGSTNTYWQVVPSGVGGGGDGSVMAQSFASADGGFSQSILTSPSFSTIGYATANLTFNQTILSAVPDVTASVQYSVNNGPWTTLTDYVNNFVNDAGTWSADAPNATLALPAEAIGQGNVRLRWNYNAAAYWWMLDNINVNAIPPASTYTWSGADGLSCMNCEAVTITPTAQGLNAYSVTATTSHNCIITIPVTVSVNAMPSAIGGTAVVCEQATTTLTNTMAGGTWSSSASATASVNPATGEVTGLMAGNATITYTMNGGCYTTIEVTVNQAPAPITGTMTICSGLTSDLDETVAGGTWSSSTISVATVSSTGLVTAVAQGTADINYTMPTGCRATATVTVYPTPTAILGERKVCVDATTQLGNELMGGTWTSGSANATIDPSSGLVSGITAGTSEITYTMGTGCLNMATVTVNTTPMPIAGVPVVCEGYTTQFTDLTGPGIWSSTTTNASVNGLGVVSGVTAGTATISYTLITGCYATRDVTVNTTPAPVTGTFTVCEGQTTALNTTTAGGTWTSASPSSGSIDPVSGLVSGILAGTTSISYTLETGCYAAATVTVNPSPAANTGNQTVCEGLTTTLANTVAGGTWISSDAAIATAGSASGVVTGVLAGNATISYTLQGGCTAMTTVTINPSPAAITGITTICRGATTALGNTVGGGTWQSSDPLVATVDASGTVTGVAGGNAVIDYTLAEGCTTNVTVTVNFVSEVYSVTGTGGYCNGGTGVSVGLSGSDLYSTYQLYNGAATVGAPLAGTGSALSFGLQTTAATYSVVANPGTGCSSDMSGAAIVSINPLPAVFDVTGGGDYCSGTNGRHVGLAASENGISYALYTGGSVVITAAGSPTGAAIDFGTFSTTGTYTVRATNSATACVRDMTLSAAITMTPSVNPAVSLSQDVMELCTGRSVTFTANPTHGGTTPMYNWSINGLPVLTIGNAYTYVPVNGDIVKAVLHSSEYCAIPDSAVASLTLTVNPMVLPSITIDAAPGNKVCKNTVVTFTSTAVNTGDSPVYTWVKNGVVVSSAPGYTYIPVDGDIVYCMLTSNAHCLIDTDVYSNNELMSVDSGLVPIVSINVREGTTVMPKTLVTFEAHVLNGGAVPSYQWFIAGSAISGATNATFSYTVQNPHDSVTVQVMADGPCAFSTFNSVIVKTIPAGVAQVAESQIDLRLMPNPNSGEFIVMGTLGTTISEEVNIEITDMLGQVVYRGRAMSKAGNINESIKLGNTLANGMYMLNVRTAGENKVFHFVLKQ